MTVRVQFLVLTILFTVTTSASGRLVLRPQSEREILAGTARMLLEEQKQFPLRKTLQAQSMGDLIARAAPINASSIARYHGNWHAYWAASNKHNQRVGKTLEAAIAWRVNADRARRGLAERMLVTSVEGFHTHAADMVDVAADGKVLGKYQAKWGWKKAMHALQNPKYAGMTIVTTRDSRAIIASKLQGAEMKAARRGVPLARKWQSVRDAVDSQRLPLTIGGKRLPTAGSVRRYDQQHTRMRFRVSSAEASSVVAESSSATSRLTRAGKLAGKALIVVDLAATGYFQYHDVQRYRSGQISGQYLVVKSGLRGSQIALATYAVVSPEPFTKAAAGVATGVLVVVDLASEPFYQQRRAAAAAILADIERDECYLAAREQLLANQP